MSIIKWLALLPVLLLGKLLTVVCAPVAALLSMRQARLALLGTGKLAGVDAAIASTPGPQKTAASIEWEYSNALQRSKPFVTQLGAAFGLDDAAIDALFVEAAKL